MSIRAISGSSPQAPPQAKSDGELRESITAKAKEANAVVLQARITTVNAIDIKA